MANLNKKKFQQKQQKKVKNNKCPCFRGIYFDLKGENMFGYLLPYKSLLSADEMIMWQNFQCGICYTFQNKNKKLKLCSNYDFAFFNIFFHYYFKTLPNFDIKRCFWAKYQKMGYVLPDNISEKISELGIILLYFQVLDSKKDKNKLPLYHRVIKKEFLNLKKKYENVILDIQEQIKKQELCEKFLEKNLDKASNASGKILEIVVNELIKDKPNKNISILFYNIGKWIYILDAIDDLDDDFKKHNYNPLLVNKNFQGDKKQFVYMNRDIIEPFMTSLVQKIENCYSHLKQEQQVNLCKNILIDSPKQFLFNTFKRK